MLVMWSRILTNSILFLSSFVNISAIFIFTFMCLIDTVLSATDSLVALSRIEIWRRPFVVVDFDQHTHVVLSLYICTGLLVGAYIWEYFISSMMYLRRSKPLTHSSIA